MSDKPKLTVIKLADHKKPEEELVALEDMADILKEHGATHAVMLGGFFDGGMFITVGAMSNINDPGVVIALLSHFEEAVKEDLVMGSKKYYMEK
jgi:hypothetical protein